MRTCDKAVTISIPSELGNEKIAMSAIATMARILGLSTVRIDDLKTVISEAVINAIEHGNQLNDSCKVYVTAYVEKERLHLCVADQGKKPLSILPTKRLERADHRGWGMFLIHSLVDEVNLITKPGQNELQMVMHLSN